MERIGLVGYSMGGSHAFALTATDTRIKLAVACVVPTSWSHDMVLAPANYARGIGDRPFCTLMGREDEVCNEAQARELYALIEGPNTELLLYDAGHTLPVEFVADATAFVAAAPLRKVRRVAVLSEVIVVVSIGRTMRRSGPF